ncbi:guanylate cyclase soluble subunit beta-2-like [Narcine bancroftii]|uniref:guanylate cyclase soluble subunit beta-2-like n=1 Tax=Narcine bancroftii TaxID=1343680 RepID=UPI003831B1D3
MTLQQSMEILQFLVLKCFLTLNQPSLAFCRIKAVVMDMDWEEVIGVGWEEVVVMVAGEICLMVSNSWSALVRIRKPSVPKTLRETLLPSAPSRIPVLITAVHDPVSCEPLDLKVPTALSLCEPLDLKVPTALSLCEPLDLKVPTALSLCEPLDLKVPTALSLCEPLDLKVPTALSLCEPLDLKVPTALSLCEPLDLKVPTALSLCEPLDLKVPTALSLCEPLDLKVPTALNLCENLDHIPTACLVFQLLSPLLTTEICNIVRLRSLLTSCTRENSDQGDRFDKGKQNDDQDEWRYGFINTCLKSLIIETFGEETWEKLRIAAEVPDTFMTFEVYSDDNTMRLVEEACKLLDMKSDVLLKQFGEYFFEFCKRSGYDRMLRTLGGNLMEFIENLDPLHRYLSLSYQEMNAPSFRVEKNEDNSMLLHYYSDRRGLHHIVPGIIAAVAMDFFQCEITMEIVSQIEDEDQTGKKEHVVFLVTQNPLSSEKHSKLSGTPQQLADVHKQSEEQLNKMEQEQALNQTTNRNCCASGTFVEKSHWETICEIVRLGKGSLLRGFEPTYPDKLWIDIKSFCNSFPFHIVFNQELRVKQAGTSIQKLVPGLRTVDIQLDAYFSIVHPEVTFKISTIQKFINSPFLLRTKQEMMPESWKHRPMLYLRGQMVWMEHCQCMLYLCSPLLRSLQELEERHMHISDIAPHDVTRDLILLNQQRLAEIELSNHLERKKEELRILSKHLEEEKKKTEALLYAMLPKHVANQLKEGKKVEAGEFKECTVLFSDVVTFTSICAQCEPIQIVVMLNTMYLKFDRLTTVHDVYKVETIGDAYMVVGGVPVPVSSHAERVANFSLAMIIAVKGVTNPVTGKPIQIRVGVTTGPVLAGVVGEKMPRYCLFGDTVNTASRMESHGVPNKIHLSPSAFSALKDKSFEIHERGEIDIKGKGKMYTYFLIRNLTASENEILGRSQRESDSGQDSVLSLHESNTGGTSHKDAKCSAYQVRQSTIVMKYHDTPEDVPENNCPKIKHTTGRMRISESYGSFCSVHSTQQSSDVDQLPKDHNEQAMGKQNQRKVRSNLCILL